MIGGVFYLQAWPLMRDPPTWALAEVARYGLALETGEAELRRRMPQTYDMWREMTYISTIMVIELTKASGVGR